MMRLLAELSVPFILSSALRGDSPKTYAFDVGVIPGLTIGDFLLSALPHASRNGEALANMGMTGGLRRGVYDLESTSPVRFALSEFKCGFNCAK